MRWLTSAFVLLVGCTESKNLPLPPDDGARSVVTVFWNDGALLHVVAADADPDLARAFPGFSSEAEVTAIDAIELACPLDQLGLTEGVQILRPEAGESARALSAYRYVLASGQWSPSPSLQVLGRLDYQVPPRCPAFTRVRVGTTLLYGIGLEDGSVLVADETELHRVYVDGRVEPAGERPAGTFGAFRTASDVWLVADDAVWRGHPDDGFERIALGRKEPSSVGWVDGTRDDGPVELVVLLESGVEVVYREGATEWDTGPFNGNAVSPWATDDLVHGATLWTGPGSLYAAGGQRLVHSKEGAPRPQPCTERKIFSGLVELDGQLIAAFTDGQLLTVTPDASTQSCTSTTPNAVAGPQLTHFYMLEVEELRDLGTFEGGLFGLAPDAVVYFDQVPPVLCEGIPVYGEEVIERTVGGAAIREMDAVVFMRPSPCQP